MNYYYKLIALSPSPPSLSQLHAEKREKLGGPGDEAIVLNQN